MAQKNPTEVADVLFARVAEVAIENHRTKKNLAAIRRAAQNGLRIASAEGATAWRDALDKIIELAK